MKPKKFSTKRQKSKLDEDCYDASSHEEDYDIEETLIEEDIYNKTIDASQYDDSIEDDIDTDLEEPAALSVKVAEPSITSSGPKKRGPKPNKTEFYVEPTEFDEAIMLFYKTGIIADNLAIMINKIAHKLSYAPNFINYTYRDEMVGDAIVRMMKALIAKKYAHAKGRNPFSYFTKIAFNAFRNRIKREKYTQEVLQKYQEEVIMNSEYINFTKNKKSLYNTEDITVTDE